jgi:putative methionine-R-sulfoxide reductase with GAF domain
VNERLGFERRESRASLLRQLLSARSLRAAMKAASDEVVDWVGSDLSWAAPIVEGHLIMGAYTGLRTAEMASSWSLRVGEGIGGQVAVDGVVVACSNYATDPRRGPVMARVIDQEGILSTLTVPVYAGEHMFGVLYAANRRIHDWSAEEISRTKEIAQTLSACVSLLREIDDARHASAAAQEELDATDRAMHTTELVADSLSLRAGGHRALEILSQALGMTIELRQLDGALLDIVVADATIHDSLVRWRHVAGRSGDFEFVVLGTRKLTRAETRLLRTSASMIGGLLTDLAIRARTNVDEGEAKVETLLGQSWTGPARAPALFVRRPGSDGAHSATDIDAGLIGDALDTALPTALLCRHDGELIAVLDVSDGIPHLRDRLDHGVLAVVGAEQWVVVIGEPCTTGKDLRMCLDNLVAMAGTVGADSRPQRIREVHSVDATLAGGVSSHRLDRQLESLLGPLAASDDQTGTDYVRTLAAYLQCDRHLARTAERLNVHPNTVRYRVARIEAILSIDLKDVDHRFRVDAALRLTGASPSV